MMRRRRRSQTRTHHPPLRRAELSELAAFARSFVPRGRDRIGGKRMTNIEAVRELIYLVGSAAGSVFGIWSEICIKTLALALADISDKEADARAVKIWRAVQKMSETKQERLRREIAKWPKEK